MTGLPRKKRDSGVDPGLRGFTNCWTCFYPCLTDGAIVGMIPVVPAFPLRGTCCRICLEFLVDEVDDWLIEETLMAGSGQLESPDLLES